MCFDFVWASSEAWFYAVWVDGALNQIFRACSSGDFFEDANEFLSDNFTFFLWVGDTFEFLKESFFGFYRDEVDSEFSESSLNCLWFSVAHEAVVNEYCG